MAQHSKWAAGLVCLALGACGSESAPAKPDLPASIAPGWILKSYEPGSVPAGVPAGGSPRCWRAEYAGAGAAEVWACGFGVAGSAFDAEQRTRAEANAVKFQEGRFLVIVKWSAGSRGDVTALVRGLQKSLQTR